MRMIQDSKGFWYDAIEENWYQYLHTQEIQPILVPNHIEGCVTYLQSVDALILTGGDTSTLISKNISENMLKRRDNTENALITEAIRRKIPILGICRGMEFLNVYFEGTLKKTSHPIALDHDIKITNSLRHSIFHAGTLRVNSFHDWGIDKLGDDLISFAIAGDGSIEGFVHQNENIIGLLWHPERLFSDAKAQKIHNDLIKRFLSLTPSP